MNTQKITRRRTLLRMLKTIYRSFKSNNTLMLMNINITDVNAENKKVDFCCVSTNMFTVNDLEAIERKTGEIIKQRLIINNRLKKSEEFLQDCKKYLNEKAIETGRANN